MYEMKKRNLSEDYLESILILQKKQGYVRSVDVSRELGVSKPSVCNAMKRLCEKKMIYFGDKGYIIFTDAGKAFAERVYKRHRLLTKALVDIGVSEQTAMMDACRIERVISDETCDCLVRFCKGKKTAKPVKKKKTKQEVIA